MPPEPALPSVSVIVPFFDSERHIEACLKSLLAQEDGSGPAQLIFVDNGSCDGSRPIVERYPEVELLHEATPGAYAARNTGLRAVRAPIVAFTDADCTADPGWLRAIREALEDPEVAVLLGHCRYPRGASLTLRLVGAYENAKAEYVLRHLPSPYHFAYANNMAVRTSVFAELGPFREWKRAGDTELLHRLATHHPHLRVAFEPSMRIEHHEFRSARKRAGRLSLYTRTNAKIESFRELGLRHRLGVLGHLLRSFL
ncbi:MAG: glycosyltransferase family 2 protein [Holophagales bacterium]|nr:glycosyltransferase family 2 protein [Holophagales bacterium]